MTCARAIVGAGRASALSWSGLCSQLCILLQRVSKGGRHAAQAVTSLGLGTDPALRALEEHHLHGGCPPVRRPATCADGCSAVHSAACFCCCRGLLASQLGTCIQNGVNYGLGLAELGCCLCSFGWCGSLCYCIGLLHCLARGCKGPPGMAGRLVSGYGGQADLGRHYDYLLHLVWLYNSRDGRSVTGCHASLLMVC